MQCPPGRLPEFIFTNVSFRWWAVVPRSSRGTSSGGGVERYAAAVPSAVGASSPLPSVLLLTTL